MMKKMICALLLLSTNYAFAGIFPVTNGYNSEAIFWQKKNTTTVNIIQCWETSLSVYRSFLSELFEDSPTHGTTPAYINGCTTKWELSLPVTQLREEFHNILLELPSDRYEKVGEGLKIYQEGNHLIQENSELHTSLAKLRKIIIKNSEDYAEVRDRRTPLEEALAQNEQKIRAFRHPRSTFHKISEEMDLVITNLVETIMDDTLYTLLHMPHRPDDNLAFDILRAWIEKNGHPLKRIPAL